MGWSRKRLTDLYINLVQKWLSDNDIFMYLTQNEGKSLVTERLIKTLKGKIYNKITANDKKILF